MDGTFNNLVFASLYVKDIVDRFYALHKYKSTPPSVPVIQSLIMACNVVMQSSPQKNLGFGVWNPWNCKQIVFVQSYR
jgi:hypothetical protein